MVSAGALPVPLAGRPIMAGLLGPQTRVCVGLGLLGWLLALFAHKDCYGYPRKGSGLYGQGLRLECRRLNTSGQGSGYGPAGAVGGVWCRGPKCCFDDVSWFVFVYFYLAPKNRLLSARTKICANSRTFDTLGRHLSAMSGDAETLGTLLDVVR